MLANRPLIVSDDATIRVEVKSKAAHVVFTADGQVAVDLQAGDLIQICKARRGTLLIDSPSRDYFEVLRTKLGWGER